jgi:hypothetical protein
MHPLRKYASAMSESDNKSLVSESMLRKLLLSVAASRRTDGRTVSESDAVVICRWAEEVLVGYSRLQTILMGDTLLDVDANGKPTFVAAETFLSEEEWRRLQSDLWEC